MKKYLIASLLVTCAWCGAAPVLSAQDVPVNVNWPSLTTKFTTPPHSCEMSGISIFTSAIMEDMYSPNAYYHYYTVEDGYVCNYQLSPKFKKYTFADLKSAKPDFEGMTTIFVTRIAIEHFRNEFDPSIGGYTIEYDKNDLNLYPDDKSKALWAALAPQYRKPIYFISYDVDMPESDYEERRYEKGKAGFDIKPDSRPSASSIRKLRFHREADAKAFAKEIQTALEKRTVYRFDKLAKYSSAFSKEDANNFAGLFQSVTFWKSMQKVDKVTFLFKDGESVTATYKLDTKNPASAMPMELSDFEHSAGGEDYMFTLSAYNLKAIFAGSLSLEFWNIVGDDSEAALKLIFKP